MKLTPRYIDICELLIQGLENKEIGAKLYLNEMTVKSHLSRIFKANKCHNRVILAVKYLEWKYEHNLQNSVSAADVWASYRRRIAPQTIPNGVWTRLLSDPIIEVYQISGGDAIIRMTERGRFVAHNNHGLVKFLERERDV